MDRKWPRNSNSMAACWAAYDLRGAGGARESVSAWHGNSARWSLAAAHTAVRRSRFILDLTKYKDARIVAYKTAKLVQKMLENILQNDTDGEVMEGPFTCSLVRGVA